MIIGGIKITEEPHSANLRFSDYGGSATDSTYYYDFTSLSWSEGPTLKDALVEGFGCTVAMLGDEPTVFVTNGKHEDYGSGQVHNCLISEEYTYTYRKCGNAYFPKPDNPTASNVTRLEQVEYLKTSTNEWIYGL